MYLEDQHPPQPQAPQPPMFLAERVSGLSHLTLYGVGAMTGAIFARIIPGLAIPWSLLLGGYCLSMLVMGASEVEPRDRLVYLAPMGAVIVGTALAVWDAAAAWARHQPEWMAIAASAGAFALVATLLALATAPHPSRQVRRREDTAQIFEGFEGFDGGMEADQWS